MLCLLLGIRIWKGISFDLGCEAYLKRAADASSIEMAKEELAKAIKYSDDNNLNSGIVSIFFKNPKNDIGYWYNNMKQSYLEMDTLPATSSSLEKTNVLMKLRESLTDQGSSSVTITVPDGITIYPYNRFFFWSILVSAILSIGLGCLYFFKYFRY